MVSTRIIIGISAIIMLVAAGSEWLAFESDYDQGGYNTLDIASAVASVYGPCGCPPSNSSIEGQFWLIMVPILVTPGTLLLGAISFVLGFVLSVISLFRWKFMAIAGALSFTGASVWVVGVDLDQAQIVHGLNNWWGYGGRTISSAVWAPIGPYLAIVSGVFLMLGYALSTKNVLDYPID